MISDKYFDKPWGASSSAAEDIRNEYRYGEGESGTVLTITEGKTKSVRESCLRTL